MNKRYISLVIVIVALVGIWFYFFMIREDVNGLTKNEIRQAEETLYDYISAWNAKEHDKSLELLSEFHSDQLDILRKMCELGSGIVYDDFQADYVEEICKKALKSVRNNEMFTEFSQSNKLIYFTCTFKVLARHEGSELGSGFTANTRYEGYGYFLVQEDGKWKILNWGY